MLPCFPIFPIFRRVAVEIARPDVRDEFEETDMVEVFVLVLLLALVVVVVEEEEVMVVEEDEGMEDERVR